MTAGKQDTRRRRASVRPVSVILLIAFLAATAVSRRWVLEDRFQTEGPVPIASGPGSASLESMPSFATALLLGGLRGPLVMTLWISSENQKQRNDLEDIDTKIEWIRLLQPEFDAVHLFQIWNKAYNISVKMTSLSNKYSTIIDAIDYGQKVDSERPDDANIISAIAQVYSDKLGTAQENPYYRRRIRRETQTLIVLTFPVASEEKFRAAAGKLGWDADEAPLGLNQKTQTYTVLLEKPIADRVAAAMGGDAEMHPQAREQAAAANRSWRRMRLPPVVDIDGNIFPELLAPRYPRPAGLPDDQPWYDGSQLQMLRKYQPFPYGVSTFALAYNGYKRTQLLLELWQERMQQSNDMAMDSRPAIMLKSWAQDEWERGRRAEVRAVGGTTAKISDPLDLEVLDGMVPLNMAVVDPTAFGLADYSYGMAARVFADARAEFYRHVRYDPANAYNYLSHIDDTIAMEQLMLADRDYLEAMTASGPRRQELMKSATGRYNVAMQRFALIMLKYFVEDKVIEKVYPKDPATGKPRTKQTIEQIPPADYPAVCAAAIKETERIYSDPDTGLPAAGDMFEYERAEYLKYLQRCQMRLDILEATTRPTTAPSSGQ